MEVDETMFPGQFHHPRFIGERGGRQQQCLVGENSVRSTGWSTGSLAENAAGRVAKRHFARACGMRSSKRSPLYSRLSCPSSRRRRSCVSRAARASSPRVKQKSRFAPLFSKKGILWGLSGLESRIIEKKNKFIPSALPFSRTIPVRTPQSASRTEESKSWMSQPRRADPRSYLRQGRVSRESDAQETESGGCTRDSPLEIRPGTRPATSGQFQFPGPNWPRVTPGDSPGHFPTPGG